MTYDLVTKGTSGGECYGTYDTRTGGSGLAYTNSCIHSGSTEYSGGNTVWYNYVVASAGTITSTDNATTATESICPKGWSLPSKKQIDTLDNSSTSGGSGSSVYVSSFSPVTSGSYYQGILYNETTRGHWWSSTADDGALRYNLDYANSKLYTGINGRHFGLSIRCVSEEKDVSDLTYMQDMTPSVAANTAEGATASLTDRRDGKFSLRSRQPRQEYQWV